MAEEEVLQEGQAQKRKEKGEGIKLIHLVVIGVILIVITALCTMFMMKSIGKFFGTVDVGMTKLITGQLAAQARTEGKVTLGECEDVRKITKDPIIVNMADGEHYISTSIAVCVEKGKIKTEEEFTMRIPQMLFIINDTLSRIRKDDLFTPEKPSEEEAAMAKELGEEPAQAEGNVVFAKNLNRYRGELLADLSRNFPFIKDVYFESFLVQ